MQLLIAGTQAKPVASSCNAALALAFAIRARRASWLPLVLTSVGLPPDKLGSVALRITIRAWLRRALAPAACPLSNLAAGCTGAITQQVRYLP